ncbi:MAG: hypothetical protein ACOVP1_00345 [Bacteroidia bacterium]
MIIDKSKIILLQNHEWGGQILLGIDNTPALSAFKFERSTFENYFNCGTYDIYNFYFFTFIPVNDANKNGFYYFVKCAAKNNIPEIETKEIILWDKTLGSFYLETFDLNKKYNTTWDIITIPNTTLAPSVFGLKYFIDGELISNKYLGLEFDILGRPIIISSSSISSRSQLWSFGPYKNKKA